MQYLAFALDFNPSTASMSLENGYRKSVRNLKLLSHFFNFFSRNGVCLGFESKRIALNVVVLKDRKIYSLQARPCMFQSGNFRGWGSQGVNVPSTVQPNSKH